MEINNPAHRSTTHLPNGEVFVSETKPVGKAKAKGYCKYCYTTHSDWHQMAFEDYGADVVLCGKCEHTSLSKHI